MSEIGPINVLFYGFTIGMARMTAILNVMPLIGDQVLQGAARNVVIFVLCLIVFPNVIYTLPTDLAWHSMIGLVFKEVVLGMLIGFLAGIPFYIGNALGFIIDTQRGSSMAQVFDPTIGGESSSLGDLFTKLLSTVFFTSGAYLAFMGLVYHSFVLWPVATYLPKLEPKFFLYFLHAVDHLMSEAVLMAAPILIVLFMMDFGLGLVNRFAPQLNVFSLGFPIKCAVALLMLVYYMHILMGLFGKQFVLANELIANLKNIMKL
jgi:type III secretion protein T